MERTEQRVGPFSADILCRDTTDDSWVLIENQLERTDHKHLGQLLTYAAGLDAVSIVWIAPKFEERHRAALDWLNRITEDRFKFFGVQISAWKIGASLPAPKFDLVSKPNNWAETIRHVARTAESDELTELRQLYLEYWSQLHDVLSERRGPLRPMKPLPQQWMPFSIGRSGFHLSAVIVKQKAIRSELIIPHERAKEYFDLLLQDKAAIEREFGGPLEWQRLEGRKSCRIELTRSIDDFSNKSKWPDWLGWHADTLEQMNSVFRERIKLLELDESDGDVT